jgi:hypothetical protein
MVLQDNIDTGFWPNPESKGYQLGNRQREAWEEIASTDKFMFFLYNAFFVQK